MNARCSIADCASAAYCRTWCTKHYARWQKHGDPTAYRPDDRPTADRFWENVSKDGPTPNIRPELGPCWSWALSTDQKGYGRFWDGKRHRKAHGYAYEVSFGSMSEGLEPDHLCRNRGCVNPDHLEAVTHRVNSQRAAYTKITCSQGHTLPEPDANGRRVCRPCANDRNARYKARKARDVYDAITRDPRRGAEAVTA
jgi:hypothetical protein